MSRLLRALVLGLITACSFAGDGVAPDLIVSNFIFDVDQEGEIDTPLDFQSAEGGVVAVNSCADIAQVGVDRIAEVDFFRFRVAQTECEAIERFADAMPYTQSVFTLPLSQSAVRQFPALVVPLLSEQHRKSLEGKSVEAAFGPSLTIVSEQLGGTQLSTFKDDVYLTVLGRGDFNQDAIEDLLIKSEWFARDAFGKHVDLVILSGQRSGKKHPILWRRGNAVD